MQILRQLGDSKEEDELMRAMREKTSRLKATKPLPYSTVGYGTGVWAYGSYEYEYEYEYRASDRLYSTRTSTVQYSSRQAIADPRIICENMKKRIPCCICKCTVW